MDSGRVETWAGQEWAGQEWAETRVGGDRQALVKLEK